MMRACLLAVDVSAQLLGSTLNTRRSYLPVFPAAVLSCHRHVHLHEVAL